jgi:hypothetical protein
LCAFVHVIILKEPSRLRTDMIYFSFEEDCVTTEDASPEDMRLQPPTGFSDSRELSEAECDRDIMMTTKLPNDLATLLARYSISLCVQGVPEIYANILTTSYWLHVELGKNILKNSVKKHFIKYDIQGCILYCCSIT